MAINTITYTDKVALNVNADVPDINKVKADDMNEIKNVVNNNANGVGDITTLKTNDTTDLVSGVNSIIDAEVYSTTEVKTNKVWTDSKPIYRKVLNLTTPNSSSESNIATLTGIDTLTDIKSFVINDAYARVNYPYYFNSGNYGVLFYKTNTGEIICSNAYTGYQNRPITVIIEYTKTTD